jgi:hypothetical protein
MPSTPSRFERTRCFRLGWVFERIGWLAMAVVLIAAAAGLFGNGWLSEREVSAGGGALTARYPRFCRAHAPLELTVEWLPRQEQTALWISRPYLDGFEIAEIRPTPSGMAVDGDRMHYTFRTAKPHAPVSVTFMLKPKRGGSSIGRVGLEDELDVEIRHFVFP